MPGGTRRIPRSVRSTSIAPPVISSFANEPCGQRYAPLGAAVPTLPALEQPAAPKHFPFPNTQVEDDLFFECLNCFFMVMAAGLQFLHMYRTVWWLPYSYTNQTVNFYLIDHHLVIFITFILCRRLLYMIGCHVLEIILPEKALNIWCYAFRSMLFGMMTVILSMSAYHVLQNHQLEKILYLCYPLCVYLLLFGFNVHPFFEFVNWSPVARPPLHACTSNAGDIRREVENLITNFNNRMKEILFNAILNAYYAGFIPCCFAEPALHYDRTWAGQHTLFILESGFVSLSVHFLSLRYCDILHRSALHLGTWDKIDTGRTMLLVNNTWKEDILWPYGALVRHGRDIWRAQGDCNSSEPGNAGLKRFYYIFKNPTNMLSVKLLVHILMVIYQLIQLVRSSVWYNIISLTLVLSFNYYVLYKICRDYLVSYKIYTDERDMHKKINMR